MPSNLDRDETEIIEINCICKVEQEFFQGNKY